MKILVSTNMTIGDLQGEFNGLFPNLSLSFFTKPHNVFQSSPVKYLITDRHTVLKRLEKNPHNAVVEINWEMSVSDLELMFEKEFGLHVQVFRKDGNAWTETTITDVLTLRQQNEANFVELGKPHAALGRQADYRNSRTEWYMG